MIFIAEKNEKQVFCAGKILDKFQIKKWMCILKKQEIKNLKQTRAEQKTVTKNYSNYEYIEHKIWPVIYIYAGCWLKKYWINEV